MQLEEKIEQWKQLKKSKAALEGRLAELRKDILDNLVPGNPKAGLDIKVRDLTSYKEDEVYNVMHHRKIDVPEFTKRIVDTDKVEQLYYEDRITDGDLRKIRDPKYVYALEEVKEESV